MARPPRFELGTLCLEGRRSIQLSYGRILGYSFIQQHLRCYFNCLCFKILGALGAISGWNGETDAHPVCFIQSTIRFEFHPRIKFRHGFWLVTHPEIVNVFLTPLTPEPRLAKATEGMESHSLLINVHRLEVRRQPSLLQIVVQVRRAVSGLE